MGRKKKPEWDDPEQSARFIELAEQIQADDAEERFEEAMKRVLAKMSTKQATKNQPKQ